MWLIAIFSPILTWIFGAFALRILVGWFLQPTYHLIVPSLAVAMGLMLIPSLFTTRAQAAYFIQSTTGDSEESDESTQRILRTNALAVVLVLVTLAFGWVVHLFV